MSREELAAILADDNLVQKVKFVIGGTSEMAIVAVVISLLSAFFAGLAALFIYRQTLADHERSRRKYAVDLILTWIATIQRESAGIAKFVEGLSPEQCSALSRGDSFAVSETEATRLKSLLRSERADAEVQLQLQDGKLLINPNQAYYLRYLAIKYLNNLEAVMTAWSYAVVDEEIIVRQYQYLVDEKEGHNAMYTFRQKMGAEHFPSINKFAKHIIKLREFQQSQIGRKKIV